MPRSKCTDAMTQAVQAHREALLATIRAVAKWASKHEGRRDAIAAGMLELLADCGSDKDGDRTQQAVSELFEEHTELFVADRANALAHALGHLGVAAQALGHRRSMHAEH
jgi:hypothetical protein